MFFRAILEKGFKSKKSYWLIKKWLFFNNPQDFFYAVNDLKEKYLLFYISFEGGYKFLNLKEKLGIIPPFGIGILEKSKPFKSSEKYTLDFIGASINKQQYLEKFYQIKKYIEEGDIYQINYTVKFDFSFKGNAIKLWEDFIRRQPVPYGVYFETPYFTAIGGSMELFLQKERTSLKSSPIKGTLPINKNPQEFFKLEKELAENLMITDMVRNDLGKVSKIGSVKVLKLFEVQTYKTVHQLVSTVISESTKNFREIIEATFPPASVTGAPKKRAVEIIKELEPHSRELYCGTVGLIYPDGNFTANVSIRTAILIKNRLSYYAGGGIVWDSIGEKEWKEVLLKVKAFSEIPKTF